MLEVKHLSCRLKKKTLLEDISFSLEPGQIVGLIGHNGAGKTTLLHCLAGLLPYQGSVSIDGAPIQVKKDQIAYVTDYVNIPQNLTISEVKEMMANLYPHWNPGRAQEIQDHFKLADSTKVKHLSKGNQAKLNMMLGLGQDCPYLLLDEPFATIDLIGREEILTLFSHFIQKDTAVLISTHEIYDVEFFLDRALMLRDGRLVQDKDLEDLREHDQLSLVDWIRKEAQ